jgi:hypothetical protein
MMRRIKSQDPDRQQLWRQGKRDFSVVDLTHPYKGMSPEISGQYTELTKEVYGDTYIYELAEVTGAEIEILGRFTSFQDAKEYAEAYANGDVIPK